ncbi:hypothetical protein D5S17_23455 [Pseudonocardiaceae bacterium YIM PH 21723]|nr:hypothetical protein D5S17_23455 [Pseudonocardiaceae bacterium YIM PH 21723]
MTGQRQRFLTEYGKATEERQRLAAITNALRAAAAPGRHQPDQDLVDKKLQQINVMALAALNELHEIQEAAANKTLRADQLRIRRNERRRGCDGRPTQSHTTSQTGNSGTAA